VKASVDRRLHWHDRQKPDLEFPARHCCLAPRHAPALLPTNGSAERRESCRSPRRSTYDTTPAGPRARQLTLRVYSEARRFSPRLWAGEAEGPLSGSA
jgi:hypothetical protein